MANNIRECSKYTFRGCPKQAASSGKKGDKGCQRRLPEGARAHNRREKEANLNDRVTNAIHEMARLMESMKKGRRTDVLIQMTVRCCKRKTTI